MKKIKIATLISDEQSRIDELKDKLFNELNNKLGVLRPDEMVFFTSVKSMEEVKEKKEVKTRYIFAKNINNTFKTGIIDVIDKVVLCYCDEWASHIILFALESDNFICNKCIEGLIDSKSFDKDNCIHCRNKINL